MEGWRGERERRRGGMFSQGQRMRDQQQRSTDDRGHGYVCDQAPNQLPSQPPLLFPAIEWRNLLGRAQPTGSFLTYVCAGVHASHLDVMSCTQVCGIVVHARDWPRAKPDRAQPGKRLDDVTSRKSQPAADGLKMHVVERSLMHGQIALVISSEIAIDT